MVTLVDRLAGTITTAEALAYTAAQIVGACIGVAIANVMFELPAIDVSTDVRSSGALWLSEFIATMGLLVVINVVITMGCGDECPYYPGKRYLDSALDDPAGAAIERVRTIRDEIRQRVERLVDELLD